MIKRYFGVFFLGFFALLLSSCFDITETYDFKNDGSYTVSYDFDMSGLMEMVAALVPDSVMKDKQGMELKDTVISMSPPDSIRSTLSASEIKMLENTRMRMRMNSELIKFSALLEDYHRETNYHPETKGIRLTVMRRRLGVIFLSENTFCKRMMRNWTVPSKC
jgi:hypothetical protein